MLTLEEKLKKIAESSQISPTPKLSLKDKLKKIMELEKTGKLQIEGELLYPLPPSPATPEEEPTVSIPPVPPETQQALEKLASGELPMQKIGELETAIPYTPPWKKQAPIPSEKELVQRQVMETLVEKSRGPFTISAENAVNSLVQEITNIPQPVKSVGSFLGYSLKSGINQADTNIVWLANQVASGTLSLGENIGELFGKPENWLEPTKLKTIQALTNLMGAYQQQASVDIEKALNGVPMEKLSPTGQVIVATAAEAISATVPVMLSFIAGAGMPQVTGMTAQVSSWAPTINQLIKMTPFMTFAGSSHAQDVENQLKQQGLPPDKAKTWGAFIVGGLFEGVTESPVFEQLVKTMGVNGAKNLFSALFTDVLVNVGQEAIMEPITKSYQQLLGLPQNWDAKQLVTNMGQEGLAGAFMGLIMGVNVKGSKTSQDKLANILDKYQKGKIDIVQTIQEIDKIIGQDTQLREKIQTSEIISETGVPGVEKEIGEKLPEEPLVKEGIIQAPIVEGTGEWKTRGLAQRIANEVEDTFGELPQYQVVSRDIALNQVQQIIQQDYQKAVKMALGEEPVPPGILPGWMWTAVKNHALLNKDYDTLNKFKSPNAMATFATILGQNVQAFADANPVDPIAIQHKLAKVAEKKIEERTGKKIGEIKKQQAKVFNKNLQENLPTQQDWVNFFDSIVCQ